MEIIDSIIALAMANGLPAGIGFAIGLLGPKVIPFLRAFAARTPTKADDMLVDALEAVVCRPGAITKTTVAELHKVLSTQQIAELVKLRKAQIEAAKK